MLTSIGCFLRKLRIDRGEILKDMANKLNVTASFLSAVENGKKKMPSVWRRKICELYALDEAKRNEFFEAIIDTEENIELNLYGVSAERRQVAMSFARKFNDIDDEQVEAIRKILKGDRCGK